MQNLASIQPRTSLVKLARSPRTDPHYYYYYYYYYHYYYYRYPRYSQCYWNDALHEVLDDFDTGFTFLSAEEIGTKLYSRQCTENVGAGKNASFAEDDPDFCRQTNELAYKWAQDHVPAHSLERFRKVGIPLTFAADIQKEGGPLWLYARLKFSLKTGPDGAEVAEVAAVSQKTEQDYWQKPTLE